MTEQKPKVVIVKNGSIIDAERINLNALAHASGLELYYSNDVIALLGAITRDEKLKISTVVGLIAIGNLSTPEMLEATAVQLGDEVVVFRVKNERIGSQELTEISTILKQLRPQQ